MIRLTRRLQLTGLLLAVWLTTAAELDFALVAGLTAALRRRLAQLRSARDRGLTTVEVALITAVLLGLATTLLVAISAVVNRNKSKIR
jgi:Na+-translocating ferredoxin:NAD+ oxidoreductase RnfA subunit